MGQKLYVVGIGPGDKMQMTQEAMASIEDSNLICGYTVYCELVRNIFPDKEFFSTPMTKEIDRCRYALEQAASGITTAMVCSGDAGVYGMAGPVLELAGRYTDVDIEIVPGITAALSGAALLGAPLTHDFCVISLSDLLTPIEKIEKRLKCAAEGDFGIAIYNPSSRKRADYMKKACDILISSGKRENTICGYVRNIGRDGMEKRVLSLSELREEKLDMFTTVFIGTSATKEISGKMVTPRGYGRLMAEKQAFAGTIDIENDSVGKAMETHPVSAKRFVIFAGTTEGRRLSHALADEGAKVTVCVATSYGSETEGSGRNIDVREGRLDSDGIKAVINGAVCCIDCTHPYAENATDNIREACGEMKIKYIRLARSKSVIPEFATVVSTAGEAAQILSGKYGGAISANHMNQTGDGNILLTTGIKELPEFNMIERGRLYVRILPSTESIGLCEKAGISHSHIIAMQGPFSMEMNTAIMKQYDIRCLVTKDGGSAGGFDEKVAACRIEGASIIVIKRPDDEGSSYEKVLEQCLKMIVQNCESV